MALHEVIDMMHEANGLQAFDKNYVFYFDETNNIRKFSLNPINEPSVNTKKGLQTDFILGGVCFHIIPNYDELFSFYASHGIIEELKSKHLFRHNNYQYDFSGNRVTALLKWFEKNHNVYFHYAIENNLYFALVDIVDSLFDVYPKMIKFHFELKDALYRVCKLYQEDILNLLCHYEYPNVSKAYLQEFARNISDIIYDADISHDFYAESLRQMLKSINKTSEMPFIVDNEPYVLQDSYSAIYHQRMMTFRESNLIFDEENEIIKQLKKTKSLLEIPRYSFVDSTTEKFIQISDCIIACLSKTFQFLDSFNMIDIAHLKFDKELKDNLRRLKSLIERSDNKNRLLILNLNAQSITQERYVKLSIICDK